MSDSHPPRTIPISQLPLWKKAKANRTLLSVSLELTARCNNDCVHCYVSLPANDPDARAKELTTDEIKALIDEAVSMGALWFLLTGGEPLLRSDFLEIYRYIKGKGGLVSLFTNASLVTRAHIDVLKKFPPRDIEVTLYGISGKTHEQVTGKKYFSATMEGLDRLLTAGLPVSLKATVLRSNYMELPDISNYCRSRSKKPFRFDPFLQLRNDNNPERNERIRAERLDPGEITKIENSDLDRQDALRKMCGDLRAAPLIFENPEQLFSCQAGINSCYISHDGVFRLCAPLIHPACTYDLRSGSLREAWTGFVPTVRSMTSKRPSFLSTCGRCDLTAYCIWCPAQAALETGSLDEHVDYFCSIAAQRKSLSEVLSNNIPTPG